VGVQFTDYARAEGRELIQAWTKATPDRYDGIFLRRSPDNGDTWAISGTFQAIEASEDGADIRYGNHLLYLDKDHDILVMAYWQKMYREREGGYVSHAVLDANTTNKMFTQFSRDGGQTWESPQQVIQKGVQYDAEHWADSIEVGKLSGMVAGCPSIVKLRDGTLLMPFQVQADPNDLNYWKQGVFRGQWRQDMSGIDWELGAYVKNPSREKSSRGIYVGTVAQLNDGRVLMIMRGFVGKDEAGQPALPGEVKWYCLSSDSGETWSKPRILGYQSGSTVWSSSSNSRLFRSEETGKLFLITHVLGKPQVGAPRIPLAIMEIDEQAIAVKEDTVTILRDRQEGDAKGTRWEIRGIYEDRDTARIVMFGQGFSRPGSIVVYRWEVSPE